MLSSPEARGLVGASLSHLAPRVTRCPAPCSEHLWDEALLSWPASPTPRDSKMAQALVRRGCRGACAPLTQAAEHVTGFPLGLGVRDVPSPPRPCTPRPSHLKGHSSVAVWRCVSMDL